MPPSPLLPFPPFASPPSLTDTLLSGEVVQVLALSFDGQSLILRLDDGSPAAPWTILAAPTSLRVGDQVRLRGEWIEEPDGSRRFHCHEHLLILPETLAGLERYLASGRFPGLGPALARRLVQHLGPDLWRALDADPEGMAAVPGMRLELAQSLHQAWLEARKAHEAQVFLVSHGLSFTQASRVVEQLGEQTLERLRQDPYQAASVRGMGFRRADLLAAALGMEADSLPRARAALHHCLTQALEEGHVCLPLEEVTERLDPLGLSPANLLRALNLAEAEGRLLAEEVSGTSGPTRYVYLPAWLRAERRVADRLKALETQPPASPLWPAEDALRRAEARLEVRLGEGQREAVREALVAPLLTITGGPGTGKTTLVRVLMAVFGAMGTKVALCAPTGRAARRLQEATGVEARTIHRLLEVQPPGMRFRRNRRHPLSVEVVLVDETSMVDLALACALLEALPEGARLILIGDGDQLPPVGPGAVFQGLLRAQAGRTVVLDRLYRQKADSRIAFNAQRILRGLEPWLAQGRDARDADFFFLEEPDPTRAAELLVELVSRRLPARYGLRPMGDIQVLTPSHRGELGVASLNARLQQVLNPAARAEVPSVRLVPGDRVLQNRNNYDLELFNGDIGTVLQVLPEGLEVQFDDRQVKVGRKDVRDLQLAYAMTVHKAQGSEFRAVVIPLSPAHSQLLQRRLLYTAVTRAKELLVLVGSRRALRQALGRVEGAERFGLLQARLEGRVNTPVRFVLPPAPGPEEAWDLEAPPEVPENPQEELEPEA